MSDAIMAMVWQLPLLAKEKLVLLALADQASDEGVCAQTVLELCQKAGMSQRSLQYSIRALVLRGAISVRTRPRQSSIYHIHLEQLTEADALGANGAPMNDGCKPCTPDFAPQPVGVLPPANHSPWGAAGAPESLHPRPPTASSSFPLFLRSKRREEKREHARPSGECHRGANPAPLIVRRETSVAEAWASLLEDWRRDVPEVNAAAFTRWIVYRETQGVQLQATQRLFQARRLSKLGDETIQAEIVEWCMGHGYKSFIPIGDIRAREAGFAKQRPANKKPWVAHD